MLFNTAGWETYGLLLLRLAVASVFWYHGTNKIKSWKSIPGLFKFIGVCETLGSIAMAFGFLTQLAGLGLGIIMLGALYKKMFEWHSPFGSEKGEGIELNLILLAAAIVLVLYGAGTISIDALAGFYP